MLSMKDLLIYIALTIYYRSQNDSQPKEISSFIQHGCNKLIKSDNISEILM